jgi:hypothetical protein
LYFTNNVQIVWDVDPLRQIIWVYVATAPDVPLQYNIADEIDCTPLLPDWRRRVADIFAEQASAETVAGEVAQSWIAEGRAEGREEGRAEGRAEGAASALREVLPLLVQARFGAIHPADLARRLARCSREDLQALQVAAGTCPDLEAWLQAVHALRQQ